MVARVTVVVVRSLSLGKRRQQRREVCGRECDGEGRDPNRRNGQRSANLKLQWGQVGTLGWLPWLAPWISRDCLTQQEEYRSNWCNSDDDVENGVKEAELQAHLLR